MTYEELQKKFIEHENRVADWRKSLFSEAESLRRTIEKKLDVENKTYKDLIEASFNEVEGHKEISEQKPYVELLDPDGKELEYDSISCFNNKNEFRFYLTLTLEKSPVSYPKQTFRLPIILKYKNNELRYNLNNESAFDPDVDIFSDKCIQYIAKDLEFNPYL